VTIALVIALAGSALALLDWRRGLLLSLLVGFVQDPLRKVVPGQPVVFTILVAVLFAACAVGFLANGGASSIKSFFRWYPALRAPVTVFVALVAVQSFATLARTGSAILAGIGLLSYLSPLVALLMAQRFCSSVIGIGRWQRVYVISALGVAISIYLAFFGFQSPFFQSIGLEIVFGRGGQVEMVSGVMRSSEISAWHCATAACLTLVWSVARLRTRAFWLGLLVTLAFVGAVLLTGRRKTLGEVLLFILFFGLLLARTRFGARRLFKLTAVLAIALGVASTQLTRESESRWNPYIERGLSVVGDAPERLNQMIGDQLYWVVLENGFFGKGAGTGAQGAQHFGGGMEIVGGGAEGGLGRILAELGVPGLLVSLWLAFAVTRQLLRLAGVTARALPTQAYRLFGLIAILPANAMVFLTAHQVFGDPFVLIVLGLVASSALAFPQILARELAPPAAVPAPVPHPRTGRRPVPSSA
jgi:hypothetical protein